MVLLSVLDLTQVQLKSIAIGDGASATTADGVAIGSKSVASTAAGVVGYNANTGRTDTYANLTGATLTSTLGGVAVGTTNQTRQIKLCCCWYG